MTHSSHTRIPQLAITNARGVSSTVGAHERLPNSYLSTTQILASPSVTALLNIPLVKHTNFTSYNVKLFTRIRMAKGPKCEEHRNKK